MGSNLGNKKIMSENIRFYMNKHNLNATNFSKRLNFKYTTVLDWLNAKTYPRIDKIEKIANYFNILIFNSQKEVRSSSEVYISRFLIF